MIYLWVAVGGALGSVARFWLGNLVVTWLGAEFPWGTLFINILGSFIISFFGLLTASSQKLMLPNEIRIFVMVGLCGGFTTFSAFSLQTVDLLRAGFAERAVAYILASIILSILACAAGYWLAASMPGVTTASRPA